MTSISNPLRRVGAATLASGALLAVLATGGIAVAAEPQTSTQQMATGSIQDASLWFLKPISSGMSMIHSVVQDRMVQRDMSGFNPLYDGELYYFHYNSSTGAYVVENFNGGCLDIKDGGSTAEGADLSLNQCDGTASQT